MKVNFKRMITALAAAAMCAVPMTSAISASAAPDDSDEFDFSTEYEMVSKSKQSKLEEELKKVRIEAFKANIDDYRRVEIIVPEREPDPKPDYSRVVTGVRVGGNRNAEYVAVVAEHRGNSLANSVDISLAGTAMRDIDDPYPCGNDPYFPRGGGHGGPIIIR